LDVIATTCLKILKQPHASSKTNGLNKIKQLLQGHFLDGQKSTTFLSQPCRFGQTHGQMVQKPGDFWGGFFCQILAGVHALQFLQRAQNIGKVVISQSRSQSSWLWWWVLRHSCFIW